MAFEEDHNIRRTVNKIGAPTVTAAPAITVAPTVAIAPAPKHAFVPDSPSHCYECQVANPKLKDFFSVFVTGSSIRLGYDFFSHVGRTVANDLNAGTLNQTQFIQSVDSIIDDPLSVQIKKEALLSFPFQSILICSSFFFQGPFGSITFYSIACFYEPGLYFPSQFSHPTPAFHSPSHSHSSRNRPMCQSSHHRPRIAFPPPPMPFPPRHLNLSLQPLHRLPRSQRIAALRFSPLSPHFRSFYASPFDFLSNYFVYRRFLDHFESLRQFGQIFIGNSILAFLGGLRH